MSRVHDALKRARGDEQTVHAGAAEAALDRYPLEQPRVGGRAVATRFAAPTRLIAHATAIEPAQRPSHFHPLVEAGASEASTAGQQYNRLAATLHRWQAEHKLKTLMVSSAIPREGKSVTIVNLALTLSQSFEKRVLLIDADLRRPSVHELLSLPNRLGLADVLRGDCALAPLHAVTPTLTVLTAGKPEANPMALVTSERMQLVTGEATEAFDWVLIDTPPVGLLPDAHLMATWTDGVLLVIAAGMTPFHLVERALAQLGPERVVGTVLNRVEEDSLPLTDYYQGYYAQPSSGLSA